MISGVILSAIFSFIYANYKDKKVDIDESYIGIVELFEDLEKNWNGELSSADKEHLLKAKKVLCEFILHRSSKRSIFINSLVGFMVLINIMNLFRKNDSPYRALQS
jgi:hypothetical protein